MSPACRGSRHFKLLGQLLCYRGFCKLLGIGKGRFSTLSKACRAGEGCPFDPRFIPKGQQPASEKRDLVFQFLSDLYHDVGEFIPDGLNSNKRPRHGTAKIDPKDMPRDAIKHLPAASISDYHRQCKDQLKDQSISRKLFCQVSRF